ncbi:MAG: glycosyltransferase family 39 protein [Bacteroidetes bacterium]|nr:glycosyltransferase family 39 protein [Bacteroidota bacterium]
MTGIEKKDRACLLILAAAWLLAALLVHPVGDFPLNDDFSYGRSVRNLVVDGQLRYDPWFSMTLLSQVLWGAGFCKIFGFSFTALRLSTLVLGWVGVVASYLLCRDAGQGRRTALVAALVVAFNPFFFSLSLTFMTDVPFFTFSILATLFFGKFFRNSAVKWLVAGTFFALAATFVRQLGLMLPLSFGVAWLFFAGLRPKTALTAAAPLALTLLLFLGYSNWLAASQGLPDGYGNFGRLFQRLGSGGFWEQVLPRTGILLTYLGGLLLPLTLLLVPAWRGRFLDKKNGAVALALVLTVVAFAAAWYKLPWGNLLYNFGVGPKLLKDGFYFINVRPVAPEWLVNLLKVIGLAGAMLLVFLMVKNLPGKIYHPNPLRPIVVFAVCNLVLYTGFLFLDLHFFDRYFFQMLPFLLLLLLPAVNEACTGDFSRRWPRRLKSPVQVVHFILNSFHCKKKWLAAAVALVLLAAFSIGTTHDYLAWNRARWQALDFLTKEKNILPSRIDGGFEFNGWHRPGERNYETSKSWWWVDRDDYVVAFGGLGNFTKEKGFAWVRWLPPGVDSVFVLKHD